MVERDAVEHELFVEVQLVRDRGHHVDDFHGVVHHGFGGLSGCLHEQWDVSHLPEGCGCSRSLVLAGTESDAVVGHHHNHGVVEHVVGAEPIEDESEQTINESKLQEVSSASQLDQPRVLDPPAAGPGGLYLSRHGIGARILLAAGQIAPGTVRHDQMEYAHTRAFCGLQHLEERDERTPPTL